MSELDDLAKAAQQVPVRRSQPLQAPTNVAPSRIYLTPTAPPRSAFWAGFSGTFGVVCAIIVIVVVLLLSLWAWSQYQISQAKAAAAIRAQQLAAERAAAQEARERVVQQLPQAPPRVYIPPPKDLDIPDLKPLKPFVLPTTPALEKFDDPIKAVQATATMRGRIVSFKLKNRAPRGVGALVASLWSGNNPKPVHSFTIEHLAAGELMDGQLDLSDDSIMLVDPKIVIEKATFDR